MTVEEENYIRELASHYLDDLLKEVNNLEEFIRRRDAVQVRTFGHRMKGTAGTLGFDELYDLGNQIEEEAGSKNWENVRTLRAKMRKAIQQHQVLGR